jgi:predicted nucleic acid-binding protein
MKSNWLATLEENEQLLWQHYEHEIAQGQRKKATGVTLPLFIKQLKAYPPEKIKRWVATVCQTLFDEASQQKIPPLLFSEVILLELIRGFKQAELPYARWLAQANSYLYRAYNQNPQLEELFDFKLLDSNAFYEIALQHDPYDEIARKALIENLAYWFDFYIHEVPAGVLVEPAVFERQLDQFVALLQPAGLLPRYEKKLALWRFHANAYRDYLARRQEFKDYADYLAKNSDDFNHKYSSRLPEQ